MATGTIQGTFGWSNEPLARGMREAEALAARGASNVSKKFESLFKRSPGRRAELAVSGLVSDLTTGNLAGAVTNFGERLSGLGLAAGVGIGAGIALFVKMREQILEANKAESALRGELAKPVSLQGGLNPEGITQQIEAIEKTTAEFATKSDTIGQKLKNLGRDVALSFVSGRSGTSGVSALGDQAEIAAGVKRESDLSTARANAELRIVEARRTGLTLSEREGELQKIALEAQQKRSKLFLDRSLTRPGRSMVDLFKSAAAISLDEKLSKDVVNQKLHIKDSEEASKQFEGAYQQSRKSVSQRLSESIETTREAKNREYFMRQSQPKPDQWDSFFGGEDPDYPKGKSMAVEMIKRGRKSAQDFYGKGPLSGLERGKFGNQLFDQPGMDIANFGRGDLRNFHSSTPLPLGDIPSRSDQSAEGGGKGGGDVVGAVKEAVGKLQQLIDIWR